MKADDEKKLAERKRHAKVARDALGENLRAIRKKKKWAQAKLAEITGLSVNEIGGMERKKIVPSLGVLMALSNGLGISISRLITPGIWSSAWDGEPVVAEEKIMLEELAELDEGERRYLVRMMRLAIAHRRESLDSHETWKIQLP